MKLIILLFSVLIPFLSLSQIDSAFILKLKALDTANILKKDTVAVPNDAFTQKIKRLLGEKNGISVKAILQFKIMDEQKKDTVHSKEFYQKLMDVHTSGHAYQEDLKLMLALIRPKYFIPIHGERHKLMLHCQIAQDMGIVDEEHCLVGDDGQVIEFAGGKGEAGGSQQDDHPNRCQDDFHGGRKLNLVSFSSFCVSGFRHGETYGEAEEQSNCLLVKALRLNYSRRLYRLGESYQK
jgi:hypothetical protein